MLRIFFSIKSPTVCAAYEDLCQAATYLRRSTAARMLFEIQDTVRKNSPMTADGVQFLEIAVRFGSRVDGMLDVAKRALKSSASSYERSHGDRRDAQCIEQLFFTAAARRDTAIMETLVDALGYCHHETHFESDSAIRRISLVMRQVYAWDPEEVKDGYNIVDYIQLLVKGGILLPIIPARCCDDGRPKVAIRNPSAITMDELVMISPPNKRRKLYSVVLRYSDQHRTFVNNAGVFTAALGGARGLLDYLQSRKQNDASEIRATMQECLLFAASLNDTQTVSALIELGVDPGTGLLSHNQEPYRKGDLSWNPMIVAAAAGSLETLNLLRETSDLDLFLESAPLYEICHVEDPQTKYWDVEGRELRRLENLRRHLLFSHTIDSDAVVANGTVNIPMLCRNDLLTPVSSWLSLDEQSRFFTVEKRRIKTIAFVRTAAMVHRVGARIDKEIIEAALCYCPETWPLQCTNVAYHPCDVLLLDGLVDANLDYHENDMDLLQLSIRAQCSLAVVEFLLSKGLRVHSRAAVQSGNTMLHDALLSESRDRSKIVHLLLREGADYQHISEGLSVLEASLHRGFSQAAGPYSDYLDIFTHLFEAGAPVRHRTRPQPETWNPLVCQLIRAGAEDDIILRVVDAGASLNEQRRVVYISMPLIEAIFGGRERLAEELIRRGADVHAPAGDDGGLTALQAACRHGSSFQFIESLIRVHGANVNEPPGENGGKTALQFAAMSGSLSLVEFLLDHGADVNALSGKYEGRTDRTRVLDVAAWLGFLDMAEFLLKAGGRSGTPGLGGAIHLAKVNGHFALLSVLLEWEKRNGMRMLEEEAEWQQQHPDAASESAMQRAYIGA
ncbi:hypothetical protein INS49_013378 [Diaporthe citri]|uniref:uncharacterized protein n=1 Tax=Diaporthe citri TaxID=83186 RepID=UPI001C7F86A5|nr:uncharacterized protein INS49_013378 [Diaporthe citri]KAG6357501.1 hypothetical protein INS49_013378 [Diaporthe citri]